MNMQTPPPDLYLVVGYDGSPPAGRALDAAVSLLHGRSGSINVVYVGHIPGVDMLSADAIAEMRIDLDDIEQELRASATEQLRDREERWTFERRHGPIAEELLASAAAVHEANPGATVAVVVGSSSQAMHRIVGSAAVSLVRHSHVPVVVVP